MERKSYDMVDVTKLGMAFLIVAIHCSAGGLNMIGRLGVPFFFIASSYFFFKRYLTQSEKQQKQMTIRYVKRIALLYCAWQIVYLPSAIDEVHRSFINNGGVDKPFTEALSIFVHYLATGLNDGWGQSWYLFASVYGVLFIVCMRRWISDWVLLAGGIVVEIILVIKFSFFNATASWYDFTFIRAIFYLMVGLLLAKYPQFIQRIQQKYSALQLTMITTFVGMAFVAEAILLNVYHGTGKAAEVEPLTAITAIVIFIWSLSLPWKVPYAREMRQMSTFIYCLHILFIRGIFVALHIHFNSNLIQWMVVSILCVVVYWIYHWFNQRYHNWWLDHLV